MRKKIDAGTPIKRCNEQNLHFNLHTPPHTHDDAFLSAQCSVLSSAKNVWKRTSKRRFLSKGQKGQLEKSI